MVINQLCLSVLLFGRFSWIASQWYSTEVSDSNLDFDNWVTPHIIVFMNDALTMHICGSFKLTFVTKLAFNRTFRSSCFKTSDVTICLVDSQYELPLWSLRSGLVHVLVYFFLWMMLLQCTFICSTVKCCYSNAHDLVVQVGNLEAIAVMLSSFLGRLWVFRCSIPHDFFTLFWRSWSNSHACVVLLG